MGRHRDAFSGQQLYDFYVDGISPWAEGGKEYSTLSKMPVLIYTEGGTSMEMRLSFPVFPNPSSGQLDVTVIGE